jgi:hypothetical protein
VKTGDAYALDGGHDIVGSKVLDGRGDAYVIVFDSVGTCGGSVARADDGFGGSERNRGSGISDRSLGISGNWGRRGSGGSWCGGVFDGNFCSTYASTGAGLLFGDHHAVVAEREAFRTGMVVDPMEGAFEICKELIDLCTAQGARANVDGRVVGSGTVGPSGTAAAALAVARDNGSLIHRKLEGLRQCSSVAQRRIGYGETTREVVFGEVGESFVKTFDEGKDLAALGIFLAGAFAAAS